MRACNPRASNFNSADPNASPGIRGPLVQRGEPAARSSEINFRKSLRTLGAYRPVLHRNKPLASPPSSRHPRGKCNISALHPVSTGMRGIPFAGGFPDPALSRQHAIVIVVVVVVVFVKADDVLRGALTQARKARSVHVCQSSG